MRVLNLFLGLLAVVAALPAQIVGVELMGDKVRGRYQKVALEKAGRVMVCGQVLSGLEIDVGRGTINKPASARQIVLMVPDPARPELPLLEPDPRGGHRVLARHRVVSVGDREVREGGFRLLFPYQNCVGLREEYLRKKAAVDALREELKACPLGSKEWFAAQRRLMVGIDGLVGWLEATLFPAAAQKLQKEYAAENRQQKEAASASRLEAAKGALRPATVPPALIEASAAFGRSDLKWHGVETQHLRILATSAVASSSMETALILGERIIEGFRVELVDPFLGPDDHDPMPEGVFDEFFLGPEEEALGTRFLEEYYRKDVGRPRERAIKVRGHNRRQARGVDYLEFWRWSEQQDLEGVVAHAMGHVLSNVWFNGNATGYMPDWIQEGFGYWISFEYLSRNSVNCVAFSMPTYHRSALKEGAKPMDLGLRAAFNALALDKGPSMEQLLRIELVEMEAADLAKAWSLVDYLVAEQRDRIVPLLKQACAVTGRDGRMNLEAYRPRAAELLGTGPDEDVYAVLDERWRRYAATTQKEEKKGRR